MALYMETTKIPADKTAGEISSLLAQAGASKVMTDYENREAVGLTFSINIEGRETPFKLPVRVEPIFRHIQRMKKPENRDRLAVQDMEQAKRVAWRQVLKWVQAQLAMIDTGMVQSHEVFMPYAMLNRSKKTLFETYQEQGLKALPMITDAK